MLGCLFILLSVGSALCGVSVQMPYLNPAGVTYTNLPAAVPSALQYIRAGYGAYGAQFYGHGLAAGHLAAAPVAVAEAAPVAVAQAAPLAVAHAAPVAVAPAPLVPAVKHLPAVAHVPVAQYDAQPAVIQNVVDVHNPKIATRRYEIRRPAIQKQFYEVEERTIVRPAGSAVVELEQPISKSQRGPTVVSPAIGPTPVTPVAAEVRAALPVAPALPAALRTLPAHTHQLFQTLPAQFALDAVAIQQPAFGPTPTPLPAIPQPIPERPIRPQPSFPQQTQPQQFDDSESVSIDNPEIARARSQLQSQQENLERSFLRSQQQISAERQRLDQALLRSRAQFAQGRVAQRLDENIFRQEQRIPERQLQEALFRSQQIQRIPQLQALRREEVNARISPELAASTIRRSSLSGEAIPSVRNLNPEVNLINQDRFISLLSARGGVSEVRGEGVEHGRARVLSVTPSPRGALPESENVKTRRIVVNRPIQTVEEVDVVEPFTKIERVAVNQPAVIKTESVGIASVPTSVPVQTYAHAVPHLI